MEYLANLDLNLSIYITLDLFRPKCQDSIHDKLYNIFGFDGQKTFAA